MTRPDLTAIFDELQKLLLQHSQGLQVTATTMDSKTVSKKRALHLYGRKAVQILNRKLSQPTYVCGIIVQKNFVGFYSMALYSHPQHFKLSAAVQKIKKGKSCLSITKVSPELLREVERIITQSIALYKKEGWI